MWDYNHSPELKHHGVLGMKWGVRRYQNKDGSLTSKGRKHLDIKTNRKTKKQERRDAKLDAWKKGVQRSINLDREIKKSKQDRKKYKTEKNKALDSYIDKLKKIEAHKGKNPEEVKRLTKELGLKLEQLEKNKGKNLIQRGMKRIIQTDINERIYRKEIRSINAERDLKLAMVSLGVTMSYLGAVTVKTLMQAKGRG